MNELVWRGISNTKLVNTTNNSLFPDIDVKSRDYKSKEIIKNE
jgi:hypothetical protein